MSCVTLKEFRRLTLDAVDEGISILGDKHVSRAFYDCLEKREKIKREEIPLNPNVFHGFMEDLFHEGTKILENRIVRSLYAKTGRRRRRLAG